MTEHGRLGWLRKSQWLQLCNRERNGQICSKKTFYHEDLLSHWENEERTWKKSHYSTNLLIRLINTFSLWLLGKSYKGLIRRITTSPWPEGPINDFTDIIAKTCKVRSSSSPRSGPSLGHIQKCKGSSNIYLLNLRTWWQCVGWVDLHTIRYIFPTSARCHWYSCSQTAFDLTIQITANREMDAKRKKN